LVDQLLTLTDLHGERTRLGIERQQLGRLALDYCIDFSERLVRCRVGSGALPIFGDSSSVEWRLLRGRR
jgi:hypothetical protein